MRLLKHIINSDKRFYFIEKVNEPLVWLIILYARRYPEPTHDNVVHPNSHILLDIREKFFECWKTKPRTPLYRALFRLVIVKYEHSATYRCMFDWMLMMIEKSGWKKWNPNRQMACWKGG